MGVCTGMGAVDVLRTGMVSELSVAHDLRKSKWLTGLDVLAFLANEVNAGRLQSPRIEVHEGDRKKRDQLLSVADCAKREIVVRGQTVVLHEKSRAADAHIEYEIYRDQKRVIVSMSDARGVQFLSAAAIPKVAMHLWREHSVGSGSYDENEKASQPSYRLFVDVGESRFEVFVTNKRDSEVVVDMYPASR